MLSKRHSMWDVLKRMEEEMDYLFDHMRGLESGFWERPLLPEKSKRALDLIPSGYRSPFIEFEDLGNELIARIELPGIDKNDIRIHAREGGIEIKAERKHEIKKEKKGAKMVEKTYSGFYRYFALPHNADINNIDSKYDKGLLVLKIPKIKSLEKKSKEIKLK